jgi:selenoprotein W-related protein
LPRAASLAAELGAQLGADPILIPGSGGVFEVVVDGRKVFSKKETGRFPEPAEISKQLGAKRTG